MLSCKFFYRQMEIFQMIFYLFMTPVPPINLQQFFYNFFTEPFLYFFCRDTDGYCIRCNVFSHYRTCTNYRTVTDCNFRRNNCPVSNPGVMPDVCLPALSVVKKALIVSVSKTVHFLPIGKVMQ